MATGADAQRSVSVLVTRPAGAAANVLCEMLRGAGYRAHSLPLLELEPLEELPYPQRRMALELDAYHHVIFVSANAVRFGMRCFDDFWPQLPAGLVWYAVGDATAKLLADYGVQAHTPGSRMSSEGLLDLPSLQAVDGQRVLIVKGEGGRGVLRRELARRGARVDQLACYRRHRPRLAAGELASLLARREIDVILISSGEGLDSLRELLSPAETSNFSHLCLIVPSERVARLARNAGFDRIVTAENASDGAMLRALEESNPCHGEKK